MHHLNEALALYRLVTMSGPTASCVELHAYGDATIDFGGTSGRMRTILAGACAGFVLAIVLFIPIFVLLVPQQLWIVLLWPPFGMGMVVGSVFTVTRLARMRKTRSQRTNRSKTSSMRGS